MIRALGGALVAGLAAAALAAGPAHRVDVEVTPARAESLERTLTITIADSKGVPVSGAVVDVTVDMPSMPMAHRVPRARAAAGPAAGSYVVRIAFEMRGEWAARVDVAEPTRLSVVRKVMIR